jgi:hypothetical protein
LYKHKELLAEVGDIPSIRKGLEIIRAKKTISKRKPPIIEYCPHCGQRMSKKVIAKLAAKGKSSIKKARVLDVE